MIPDRIFLVGFAGSPLREVGAALSERLGRPMFDTEAAVEAAARMSSGDLYRREGEGGLRQRERRALVGVATGPPAVIVTGPNLYADRGNRRTIGQSGVAVFLDATLEECLEGAIERGLIRVDGEQHERFATLFDLRRPEYDRAEVIVEPQGRDAESIAEEIVQRLEDRAWSDKLA
jgi:shikimate kinase